MTEGGFFVKNNGTIILVILVMVIGGVLLFSAFDSGSSHEHKSAYSQLSPQEQENARWAYEAKKAIDNYNK